MAQVSLSDFDPTLECSGGMLPGKDGCVKLHCGMLLQALKSKNTGSSVGKSQNLFLANKPSPCILYFLNMKTSSKLNWDYLPNFFLHQQDVTRSIFKQSTAGLNREFSFYLIGCQYVLLFCHIAAQFKNLLL